MYLSTDLALAECLTSEWLDVSTLSPPNVITGVWGIFFIDEPGDRVSFKIATNRSNIIPNINKAIVMADSWTSERAPFGIFGSETK